MPELVLARLVNDIADSLVALDRSGASHKAFKPGIGPFGEGEAVRGVLTHLKNTQLSFYTSAVVKRTPDLLIPNEWAVELKIVRPYGDNNKPAEHWSQNVLHPYEGNTSSLGDCLKLLNLPLTERKAVIVFGFEHSPPLVGKVKLVSSPRIRRRPRAYHPRSDPSYEAILRMRRPDPTVHRIWIEKAERRLTAYRAGKVRGIPAEDVVGPL